MASLRLVPVSHGSLLSKPFATPKDLDVSQHGTTSSQRGQVRRARFTGALHARAARDRPGESEQQESHQSMGRELMVGGLAALLIASAPLAAEATIQKVEGRERGEQGTITSGIREPSMLGSGKGNTIRESIINTQASGGTILGAPKLEEPAGAYRAPQSSTSKTTEEGVTRKSVPAGILQSRLNDSEVAGR